MSSDDAPYAAFCRGPLTLARDARLGEDVDAPVRLTDEEAAAGAAAQRRENGSYRGFLWFLAAFAVLALLLWMAAGEY